MLTATGRPSKLPWPPPGGRIAHIFSVLFLLYVFNLVRDAKPGGAGLALVIFVLALFAISPAVLLLLERPLKGLDSYSPTGPAPAE